MHQPHACHPRPSSPSHAQAHPHHRSKGRSCHPRHPWDAEVGRPGALAEAEGEALRAEGDGLLDGAVDALAVGDVEVGEVVLMIMSHGSAS